MIKFVATTFTLLLLAAGCGSTQPITSANTNPGSLPVVSASPAPSTIPTAKQTQLTEPISGGLSRVTKKPFGIYITPATSPVQPEKFTGYHTGIDFETTPAEANIDIPIMAACKGKLLMKKYATGYGGVAVQSCILDGNAVTLIYGHLRLSSISPVVGQTLTAGEQIAVLGTGYSNETDGERKHLHFGIHVGTAVNILGYVQTKATLSGWLDAEQYLK